MPQVDHFFCNVITALNTLVQQNKHTMSATQLEHQAALTACQVLINEGPASVLGKMAKLNPDFVAQPAPYPLTLGAQGIIGAAIASITFTLTKLHQITPQDTLDTTVHQVWINEGAFMTAHRTVSGSAMSEAERQANCKRSEADILAELASAEGGCANGACAI